MILLHYYQSANTKVFPCNITVNDICRPLISHCNWNIFGRISTSWEQVQRYATEVIMFGEQTTHITYCQIAVLDVFRFVLMLHLRWGNLKVPLLPALQLQSVEDVTSKIFFGFLHGKMLHQTGYHLVIPWLGHSSFQGTCLFFWVRPQDSVKTTLGWYLTRLQVLVWLCRKEIATAFVYVWLMKGIFTLNPSAAKDFLITRPWQGFVIPKRGSIFPVTGFSFPTWSSSNT